MDDGQAFRRRAARRDLLGRAVALLARGGAWTVAGIGHVPDRDMDDAEDRDAVLDEADIDGELAVAVDELLGAVERVDEPEEGRRRNRQAVRRRMLLGDDRDVRRRRGESLEDQRLGMLVGKGHRRGVVLAADGEILRHRSS